MPQSIIKFYEMAEPTTGQKIGNYLYDRGQKFARMMTPLERTKQANTSGRDSDLRSQKPPEPTIERGLRDSESSSIKQVATTKSISPPVLDNPKVYDNPLAGNTKLNTDVPKPAIPITKRLATVSNADKMTKAKSDATNAAIAYKKNNPDWDKDTKVADNTMTPGEVERKTAYVSPQADTTSSLAKMTPGEAERKFDYASAAGNAVNTVKRVGSSLIDKVKDEAPAILAKGKNLISAMMT